jgi:class 3 adenylate cyclase/tetratricopeptide (TPR) repeat protein
MKCVKCGADNRKGRKFCAQCATPLARSCPKCGATNEPGEDFCGDCGGNLSINRVDIPSPQSASSIPGTLVDGGRIAEATTSKGERRHLTVLFCDLVDSTEIAARLDPEEWRDVIARYQQVAAQAVVRFGGHVAQYLGDGVLVLFGYPTAHENDAERAVRTGLAIIDGVTALNVGHDAQRLPALAARVGIHTGPVVVGDSDNKSANLFGDTPNIAARIQAAAEPNTVVVSAAVYQPVFARFVVEDRGTQTLKGVGHPIQLYRVIQPSVVRRPSLGVAARVLTPFVGREDETRLLLSRWERAHEGQGQVVLVVGEPGIGKSRLLEEFRAHIKDDPHLWIEGAGEQSFANTPFHALSQMLDQILGWRGDESGEVRAGQLERALEVVQMKLGEAVPLIAEILNLPIPEKYPPLLLAPDQKRKRLMANLAGWMINASQTQSLVMAIEDLQWVDPSTLELLNTIVEQSATVPLMLLSTARPEFHIPWAMRAHHAQITLTRLNDRHIREMVANLAAGASLNQDVINTVVGRTDGVPLFAEELTRLVLEGDRRVALSEIPATLQNSLTARLDRLGLGKEVAQLAAVIGREFSYELLEAVSPLPGSELQAALGRIADAELVYPRGTPPDATYQFKHALVRDTAYETLLKSQRRELHRRVAETLAEKFPALPDAQPELLARHWTEAGVAEPAVAAWRKAGRQAVKRFASAEAVADFSRALKVLNNLPESRGRDSEELSLQMLLTTPLIATKGYTAPEVEKAYYRARELSERMGDTPHLSAILGGLTSIYIERGELPTALQLANQMLSFAERKDDPVRLVWAHNALGVILEDLGEFSSSRHHFEKSIAHYDFQGQHNYGWVQDPGACGLSSLANVLQVLGYPEKALEKHLQSMDWARRLGDPYTLQWVWNQDYHLHFQRGEYQSAIEAAEQRIVICEKHRFEPALLSTIAQRGLALTYVGRDHEGMSQILQIWERVQARTETESRHFEILYLAAEAYWRSGQAIAGLKAFADAQALSNELGPHRGRLRLKGNLLLLLKDPAMLTEAELLFRSAIQIERSCGAKWMELQSTTALARLLRDTNRRDEARAILSDIYNWFTEGFDTADLKDAKALLEELKS